MLTRLRRWTPERRAFVRSVVVRPSRLVALLLLLWGNVVLVVLVTRVATHGVPEVLFTLFEAPGDRPAAVLNAGLALLAAALWLLIGIGAVQRRLGRRKPEE